MKIKSLKPGCLLNLILILAVLCSPLKVSAKKRLIVITSIFPLQEFTRAIGGERVYVHLLLPPGAEPHSWEPKPEDIINIMKADIFIYIGGRMEPWIKDILNGIDHDFLFPHLF